MWVHANHTLGKHVPVESWMLQLLLLLLMMMNTYWAPHFKTSPKHLTVAAYSEQWQLLLCLYNRDTESLWIFKVWPPSCALCRFSTQPWRATVPPPCRGSVSPWQTSCRTQTSPTFGTPVFQTADQPMAWQWTRQPRLWKRHSCLSQRQRRT